MLALRRRHRHRRIADLGGHPVSTGWPYHEPDVLSFQPEAVDRSAAHQEIKDLVTGLLPHAVDEATGDAPAELINMRAEQWIGAVDRDYRNYLPRASHRLGMAAAATGELGAVLAADRRDLAELDAARTSTFAAMTKAGPRTDYGNAGLVGGRSAASYVHYAVLAIAALADIGAFAQIVQLIMKHQPAIIAFAVVLGLTTSMLFLAHAAGLNFRERTAGVPGRLTWAWLCVAVWFLVGLAACWVRLSIADSPGSVVDSEFSAGAAPVTAGVDRAALLSAAIVFLALYLGTGLVAMVGAYVTHNPLPGAYRAVCRRYDRAAERVAASCSALSAAVAYHQAQQEAIDRAEDAVRTEQRERRALADELKEYAKTLMAQHAQDAAFTDALFGPDRMPYGHTTNGSAEPIPPIVDAGSPR